MFRRILVPVDGSTFAEHALPWAQKIARAHGAELHVALVHVSYTPATADEALAEAIREWETDHRTRESDYLTRLVERLGADGGGGIRPALLNGGIVGALDEFVRDNGIDLIVMTTHGRAGLERAWLGSVADALIRQTEAPVLLIRPGEGAVAMTPEQVRLARVLVALDGSDVAERALAPAAELARTDGARVTLLRVVAPPLAVTSPFMPHAVAMTRDEIEDRLSQARNYLAGKVAELERQGVDARAEAVVNYHAAHAVLEHAEAFDADLVALGTHGRGPLTRLVLGSVSDKVVRAARTPVLIC